jgi:toxin ParE1/3/4
MACRLSRKAAADVRHIYTESIRQFGPAQAARYHARLRRTFDLLVDSPELARERVELSPPVRVHPCGSHVVIYLIEEDGGILIVRVRHSREDWTGSP